MKTSLLSFCMLYFLCFSISDSFSRRETKEQHKVEDEEVSVFSPFSDQQDSSSSSSEVNYQEGDPLVALEKEAEVEAEKEAEKDISVLVAQKEKEEAQLDKKEEEEIEKDYQRAEKEVTERENQLENKLGEVIEAENQKDALLEKELEGDELQGSQQKKGQVIKKGLSNAPKLSGLKYLGRGYNTVYGGPEVIGREIDPGIKRSALRYIYSGSEIEATPVESSPATFHYEEEEENDYEELHGEPGESGESSALSSAANAESYDGHAEEPYEGNEKHNEGESGKSKVYQIPDGVELFFQPECQYEKDVAVVNNKKALQDDYFHSIHLPKEFEPTAFSRERDVAMLQEEVKPGSRVLIMQRSQCIVYRSRINDEALKGGKLRLSGSFVYTLNHAFYNNTWRDFISQYGVGYIHDMDVGGGFFAQTRTIVSKFICEQRKRIAEGFDLEIPPESPDGQDPSHHLSELGKTKFMYKGGDRTKKVGWAKWYKTLHKRYVPINLKINPLWELLDYPALTAGHFDNPKEIKEALKRATAAYFKYFGRIVKPVVPMKDKVECRA